MKKNIRLQIQSQVQKWIFLECIEKNLKLKAVPLYSKYVSDVQHMPGT